jgi:hypothetical protein
MVINQVQNLTTALPLVVSIGSLRFNGTIESVNVTPDGRLGVGVTAPTQALEVAGSAVVAGTLSAGNPLMFRNAIINGNFDIWQRGTSFSVTSVPTYTSDRWRVNYDGTGATRTLSRQTFTLGQTAVPGNPKYYLLWAQTVAGSGGTFNQLEQLIESVLTFAGQTVTVSFWAQAVTGTPTITVYSGQQFGSGGSPSTAVYPANSPTYTLSTSWQYFTWTIFLPSITGKTLGTNGDDNVSFAFRAPSNATGTWNIASVQVEAGSIATPFEFRPFATELALCQRYYEVSTNANYMSLVPAFGATYGSTTYYKVSKRANPTVSLYDNTGTGGAGAAARFTGTVSGGGSSVNGLLPSAEHVGPNSFTFNGASGYALASFSWNSSAEL